MEHILIHPTYFPSIAHMVAVAKAKTVHLERCDNYQKQSYRNRMYIAHSNGVLTLNIPVKHNKNGERQQSATVKTEPAFPWQRDHWRSIQNAYRTSPFFEYYEDELAPIFTTPPENLIELNTASFLLVCELLGLTPEIRYTSAYFKDFALGTDLRNLVDFKKTKLTPFEPYTQVLEASHGFLNNLSVMDLLFNEGPASSSYLERQNLDFIPSPK